MEDKQYANGVMVFGESGSVFYVGVVRDKVADGRYEIYPVVMRIEDRCYNLSDPIHELKSIKGEVTSKEFDFFADVRKQKILSYEDVSIEEFMLSFKNAIKIIKG